MLGVANFSSVNILSNVTTTSTTVTVASLNNMPVIVPFRGILVSRSYTNLIDAFSNNAAEIVEVTSNLTTTLTISRGQEETTIPRAFTIGDYLVVPVTPPVKEIISAAGSISSGAIAIASTVATTASNISSTTVSVGSNTSSLLTLKNTTVAGLVTEVQGFQYGFNHTPLLAHSGIYPTSSFVNVRRDPSELTPSTGWTYGEIQLSNLFTARETTPSIVQFSPEYGTVSATMRFGGVRLDSGGNKFLGLYYYKVGYVDFNVMFTAFYWYAP